MYKKNIKLFLFIMLFIPFLVLNAENQNSYYRYSDWTCYDGGKFENKDDSSCKSYETWQKYADEYCKGHCNNDNSKCGVDFFGVSNDCSDLKNDEGIEFYDLQAEINEQGALITWKTNINTDSRVYFGKMLSDEEEMVGVDCPADINSDSLYCSESTKKHSIQLKIGGLKHTQAYFYKVKQGDAESESKMFVLKPSDLAEYNIFHIYNEQVLKEDDGYLIKWSTNRKVDCSVEYYDENSIDNEIDPIVVNAKYSYPSISNFVDYSYSINVYPNNSSATFKYLIECWDINDQTNKTKSGWKKINIFDAMINSQNEYEKLANLLVDNDERSIYDVSALDELLYNVKEKRDIAKELSVINNYFVELQVDEKITAENKNSIIKFIAYGVDKNTKFLGMGERAAIIFSYKNAFGKLPKDETDFADVIRISNGLFPEEKNNEAEKKAKENFKKIYKKIVNSHNISNDEKNKKAINIMAYGIKQKAINRNLENEKLALSTFQNIYGHTPAIVEDWNIVQAIAYSGAIRENDSDEDLLVDTYEKKLGTDINNPDTDGDGYFDGEEIENGYDPLVKYIKRQSDSVFDVFLK